MGRGPGSRGREEGVGDCAGPADKCIRGFISPRHLIVQRPIGEYPYLKRLKSGAARPVIVDVYPLEVTGEHAMWPEKGQRTLQWMTPVEAALAVQEPELRDLIARFAKVELPAKERPEPAPAPTPVQVAFQRLRRRVTALWGRSRR